VVVGAGYDTRAWRLRRPGVACFEVDHPATQADKRARAPSDGPTYVPLDLVEGSIAAALPRHGFAPERPTVFVVEGLTMYLDEAVVARLLADLARIGAPGSRLAVNFTVSGGGSVAPASRLLATAVRAGFRTRGEAIVTWVRADRLEGFVAGCGWEVDELVAAPALGPWLLEGPRHGGEVEGEAGAVGFEGEGRVEAVRGAPRRLVARELGEGDLVAGHGEGRRRAEGDCARRR